MNAYLEMIEYNTWANRRLLSQSKELAREEYFQHQEQCLNSIRLSFLHMLKADWVWLDLWRGQAITDCPSSWDKLTLNDLESLWSSLQGNILSELSAKWSLLSGKQVEFSNGDEQIRILKFWKTIVLAVNHDTYYRGQIANMIETLGVQPVSTQMFDYYTRRVHH